MVPRTTQENFTLQLRSVLVRRRQNTVPYEEQPNRAAIKTAFQLLFVGWVKGTTLRQGKQARQFPTESD